MNKRISLDTVFMTSAMLWSERSTCPRGKVGAILVLDNRIVSTGYVGAPSGHPHCFDVGCDIGPEGGCVRTIHGEANCIHFFLNQNYKNKYLIRECTLYTTLSPCMTCAKLIVLKKIPFVVYKDQYRKTEPIEFLLNNNIKVMRFEPEIEICQITK